MKQKRKVSVLIALMMLLTVFAVPSMAFGAEEDYDYEIAPATGGDMPDYLRIGEALDLNVVSDPAGAAINQSDWTWKVTKSDSYFKGKTSALATIDQNGVLTARSEGVVRITATNKITGETISYNGTGGNDYGLPLGFLRTYRGGENDDYYDYDEYDGPGYRGEAEIRIYPGKTAKLMKSTIDSDSETYAVPTQILIEKLPDSSYGNSKAEQARKAFATKYQGAYRLSVIAEDAINSDQIKKFIVPDTVKSIGKHAIGYKKISHFSYDPSKATYVKTNGVVIYGSSNKTAAAKYAKANGFTYKNMENGKTITVNATAQEAKPKKIMGIKARAGKKKMTITWKRNQKAGGYQITYAQNKSFKKGKKNINIAKNKITKKVVKKLNSDKKYFVKVRAYKKFGNKKVYGTYSNVKQVKVK